MFLRQVVYTGHVLEISRAIDRDNQQGPFGALSGTGNPGCAGRLLRLVASAHNHGIQLALEFVEPHR